MTEQEQQERGRRVDPNEQATYGNLRVGGRSANG